MRRSVSQRSVLSWFASGASPRGPLSWHSRCRWRAASANEIIPAAIDIPQAYRAGPRNADAALPSVVWWRGFRSKELTDLIEEALTSNFDVAAAVARIVQADAQSRIVGRGAAADRRPQRRRHALARPRRPPAAACGGGIGRQLAEHGSTATSLSASYEIDFWGKNRAALRAAEELAVASRFDREVVALTTVVSVANSYFLVLAAHDRLRDRARQPRSRHPRATT